MLVSFEFSNFRSVKDNCLVDFRKLKMSQHKESLINDEYLPVTVFYGPNGGGKSTIIYAIDYLINLVVFPMFQSQGKIFTKKAFKPFLLDRQSSKKPTEFCLTFCLNEKYDVEYRYYIKIKENDILEETLYFKELENDAKMLFERKNGKIELGLSDNAMGLTPKLSSTIPFISMCAVYFPKSTIGKIGAWFQNVLVVDYGNPGYELIFPNIFASIVKEEATKKLVESFMKELKLVDGFDVETINSNGAQMNVIKTMHNVSNGAYALAYEDESMGTKKMMQLAPSIALALSLGNVLVVDELDAKLHPKLIEYIISLFTNKDINKKGAQLIFTSHDMYTLNSRVFRRDEIYFSCKDEKESTIIYSLADIRSDDHRMNRVDASYSKKYLEGKYGSDPYYNLMSKWEDVFDEN